MEPSDGAPEPRVRGIAHARLAQAQVAKPLELARVALDCVEFEELQLPAQEPPAVLDLESEQADVRERYGMNDAATAALDAYR